MIKSKKELKFYIMADMMMNRDLFHRTIGDILREIVDPDYIMRYLRVLRKRQYYSKQNGVLNKFCYFYYRERVKRIGIRLGYTIGNGFGYGLVIPHWGTIVAGGTVGNYAVLQTSICLTGNVRTIGDGLYVSTGAKIVGEVDLGDNITVAPNAVVTKNRKGNNLFLDGSPAEIKRENYPAWYVRDGEEYAEKVRKVEELRVKMGL